MSWCVPFIVITCCLLQAGNSVPLSDLFNYYIDDLASDYSNGARREDLPEKIKIFLFEEITLYFPEISSQWNTYGPQPMSSVSQEFSNAKNSWSLIVEPLAANDSHLQDLPSPSLLFDTLFKRSNNSFQPSKLNYLLLSFVNWFLEDALKTQPGSQGRNHFGLNFGISLTMVYGKTPQRETMLRDGDSCRLRTSLNRLGQKTPLTWGEYLDGTFNASSSTRETPEEAKFYNKTNYGFDFAFEDNLFLTGDDFLNVHWGHLFWNNIFILRHNDLCDVLSESNPDFSSDALFERVHVLNIMSVFRIILEDYVSMIAGINNKLVWKFDHKQCHVMPNKADEMFYEFNTLYKWHNLIPETLSYKDEELPLQETMFNASGFSYYSLQQHMEAFYATNVGRFGVPNNEPNFIRNVTIRSIEEARAIGIKGFNDYWEHYGYGRLKNFNQFTDDDNLAEILDELYNGNIDDMDLYVGIMLQNKYKSQDILPKLMRSMIAEHAFSLLYSGPGLCALATESLARERLTNAGYEAVYGPHSMLEHVLSTYANYQYHRQNPFITESNQKSLQKMCEANELSVVHILDFVGMNELWGVVLDFDVNRYFLAALVLNMAVLIILYATVFKFVNKKYLLTKEMNPHDLYMVGHYIVTGVVYLIHLPFYTYFIVFYLFSCRQDQTIASYIAWMMCLALMHGPLYIVDIYVRHINPRPIKFIIVLHHFVWFFLVLVATFLEDIFAAKIAFVLDYFSVYEFGLFFLMAYSKLNNRMFSPFWIHFGRFSVLFFAISRLVQFILLAYFFVETYDRMHKYGYLPMYLVQLFAVLILFVAQIYTVVLYLQWKQLWGCLNTTKNQAKNHLDMNLEEEKHPIKLTSQVSSNSAVE